MELDNEESRLLLTFVNGPRIWDAASVFAVVLRLEAKGMVAPADSEGKAYELTEAGRWQVATSNNA